MNHFLIDYINTIIPANWKSTRSGNKAGNCPLCRFTQSRPDSRGRGNILIEHDHFHYNCYNCKFNLTWRHDGKSLSAKMKHFLSAFGATEEDIQKLNIAMITNEYDGVQFEDSVKLFEPDWPEIELPEGSVPITEAVFTPKVEGALRYIAQRGLIHWGDWHYNPMLVYSNYVIIPARHKGKIVGFYNRYIGLPPKHRPKYLKSTPAGYLFNLDNNQTDDRSVVIAVEGILDAMSIDAVAFGTNAISKEHVQLLTRLNKKVIVVPDADDAGNNVIRHALENNWAVSFPPWMERYKDVNEASAKLGGPFVLYSILKSAMKDKAKITLFAKKYCK